MRIAINTRYLIPNKMEGFGWYTYEICKRIVKLYPQHEFYFFFDRKIDSQFVFSENITPIILRPPARHPMLFYIWYEWSVRRAIKKYQIDLFFSPDGYLSLGSDVKQIAVLHDLNYEHHPEDLPKHLIYYLHHFFPKFAQKASKIITVSNYSKADIVANYHINPEKIEVVYNGASEKYKVLDESRRQAIRTKYSDGEAYFLFVGSLHPRKNLKRLIEAFQQFKLTSKSKTKLLIIGEVLWDNKFVQHLQSEVDSNEIKFVGRLPIDELALVMASAKLFTYIPYFEGFGIPLAEAMRCGTPILSGNLTALPEVAGDAAVYCDPFDVHAISSQMQLLDQDENLLQTLSQKGLQRSTMFSWDKAAMEVGRILGL